MKPVLALWSRPDSESKRNWTCGLLVASMLLVTGLADAQDSLRNSLAGDAAAEAQRQQVTNQLYTFKAGDFRLLAVPSVEMDYNDNVTISKINAQSDFILKPLVQLTGSYPVTQQNLLSLAVGLGYDEYLEHSRYSGLRVDSASQLSFDMRIKDFLINFHDRFSFTRDPSTEASLAGTAEYGGLMNSAGLTTTWDLEDVVLTLGYDHQNFISSASQFSYLDRSSELPMARAGFKIRPDLTVGVEGTASFASYDQAVLNNNSSYSAGLYADYKPGSYFDMQPRAGYVIYQFQHTSQTAPYLQYLQSAQSAQILPVTPPPAYIVPETQTIQTENLSTWYADLTLSHQASDAVNYALSAGHEMRLGIEADLIEDWYFRPNITWKIVKDLNLNTSLFYEHGNEGAGNVSGNLTETYDWYGGGLNISYPLMKKLTLNLNYRLTLRSSDIPDRDYAQNIVGLRLTYQPK
jgi:hypothetical protein